MTCEEAIKIYEAGAKAVVEVLCELSQAIGELQRETQELREGIREFEEKL